MKSDTHGDDASPSSLIQEILVQTKETRRPVHHDRLQLSAGRRASPTKARIGDARRIDVREDGDERGIGGEVGKESDNKRLGKGSSGKDLGISGSLWVLPGRGEVGTRSALHALDLRK